MRRAPCPARRARHRAHPTPGRTRRRLAFACIWHLPTLPARETSLARRLTRNALSSVSAHICTHGICRTLPRCADRLLHRRSSNLVSGTRARTTIHLHSPHFTSCTPKHLQPHSALSTSLHCTHCTFWHRTAAAPPFITTAHGQHNGTQHAQAHGS